MARKRRKNKRGPVFVPVAVPVPSLRLDSARDYLVYWRNGLKSRCHGGRLVRALGFYLSRVRLILDAETGKKIYVAEA